MKAGIAHWTVTAEGYVHDVRAAFYLLWQLAVLKCPNQMTVGVRAIINVQKVIIGLDAEAEMESKDSWMWIFYCHKKHQEFLIIILSLLCYTIRSINFKTNFERFLTFGLCTLKMKWNHQDVSQVKTFSFKQCFSNKHYGITDILRHTFPFWGLLYLNENMEPMDLAVCRVSSLDILCQTFTAAAFRCCLFVGSLPSVLSLVSERHFILGWDQVTDLANEEYHPWNSWVA